MKRRFAFVCLPALLAAAAPSALVTGAVRDQFGEPIAGATISAGAAQTRTDAAGTFALETSASIVRIACAYCRPIVARVGADGTVTAIVERFRAVASDRLTEQDLRRLPYAHVESAIALQPFVVLNDSKDPLPGPRLSLYGISPFGGLLVVDGLPSYDIAAGITPFRSIPGFDAAGVTVLDQTNAFRYGDYAGAGTFIVRTQPADVANAFAFTGTQRAANVAQADGELTFNAADSASGGEDRERMDASMQVPLQNDVLTATLVNAADDDSTYGERVGGDLTGARLHFDGGGAGSLYADLTADRARYSVTAYPESVEGGWSDFSFQAGLNFAAKIATFVDTGMRYSSGYYDAGGLGNPRIAGSIAQAYVHAGAAATAGKLSWRAGVGAFDVGYDGGSNGVATPLWAHVVTPSIAATYELGTQWNVALEQSESFRLPTLLEAYGYSPESQNLDFDRYSTQDVRINFGDVRRVRASLVAMKTRVGNLDNGSISALGASCAWQLAPELSVRAWSMHLDDTSRPYEPLFRYGMPPQPATPSSIWTTYENPRGIRADVIWRRDLLDYRPDPHVDASVGATVLRGVSWFVGTERRSGLRLLEAGLRFGQ